MSNYEKITASPEVLGEFLAALPIADGPWDASFREKFYASCEREDCDTEHCPHQGERSNPKWWLTLGEELKAAPALETQGRQEIRKTDGASDREMLIREYERRLARLKSGASPGDVIFQV